MSTFLASDTTSASHKEHGLKMLAQVQFPTFVITFQETLFSSHRDLPMCIRRKTKSLQTILQFCLMEDLCQDELATKFGI